MHVLRAIGRFIWRFMVIFSFIVNIVLLIVVGALLIFIFDIKNNIAEPLVAGLHSSFVGLDQATIDWTIPVRANVPVNLDIPLKQNTIVTLTQPVDVEITGGDIFAGNLTLSNATIFITLPQGLQLPVALDLPVAVRDTLPVELDVRAVIPLSETQLHDPFENLRLMFEPLAVGLYNLPDDFSEVGGFVNDVLSGNANLLAPNEYSARPWTGFSRTAGLNYPESLLNAPVPPENQPVETGIVPLGGIPGLDEQLRPDVYGQGGPAQVNQQRVSGLQNLPEHTYRGTFGEYLNSLRAQGAFVPTPEAATGTQPSTDLGITTPPTPTP